MMNALESLSYPGYFDIPGYSRYVISTFGEVINKETSQKLTGSRNPNGYYNYRLKGDDGHTLTWGRHRLIGFVFKNPGTINNLAINHKNGVKGSDEIDNLEWVTYQGNAEHAGAAGLTEKCIPISVRDVDTGDVMMYPSIVECARDFSMTKDAVNYRVKTGERRVFPERKQYRSGHSAEPWYIPEDLDKALLENGLAKKVLLRDLSSNKVIEFSQLTQLANYMGSVAPTVSTWLNQPNQPVLPGFIQVKLSSDESPWREVTDMYLDLEEYTKKRIVMVRNEDTETVKMFLSAKECSLQQKLLTTTLSERLKSKGTKVYNDGCRYAYYSDIMVHPVSNDWKEFSLIAGTPLS